MWVVTFRLRKKSSKSPCILFRDNGMVSEWYCIRPEFDGCFLAVSWIPGKFYVFIYIQKTEPQHEALFLYCVR